MLFMEMIAFGDWLVRMMADRNMSQSDLARASNIGKSTISDIISGRRKIGKDVAVNIAKGLRVPPAQVFQAAGLLPPDKVKHDEEVEQIIEELGDLSQNEKKEVLSYIRWRRNNKIK